MKTKIRHALSVVIILLAMSLVAPSAFAQVGYNPEFLGNAAAAPRPGFSPKIFVDYYNQNSVSGNDFEIAFEPQYWIRGFTGKEERDYIQFLLHFPIGYRSQKNVSERVRGFGTGMLNANVEHFWKLIDDGDTIWWFDNGLSAGFPTATGKEGLRIGGKSYTATWFQENYLQFGKWVFSISPIAITYVFRDSDTQVRPGLALNVMNNAYGYQVTDWACIGVTNAYQIGNVAGTSDNIGGSLDKTQRLYVGPAFNFTLFKDTSLQVSGLIDVYTKNVVRGQGIAMAFWHMF